MYSMEKRKGQETTSSLDSELMTRVRIEPMT